ncbi:MAG TPA: hypothetical protein VGI52_04110, partial [Solirubrobacteraceae bacterium]
MTDPGGTASGKPAPMLVGSLALQVHNSTGDTLRVRVHYVRSDGAQALLPGESVFVRLRGQRSPSKQSLEAVITQLRGEKLPAPLPAHVKAVLTVLERLSDPHGAAVSIGPSAALLARAIPATHRGPRLARRAELDPLAAELTRLLAPAGSGAKLDRTDARRLLDELNPHHSTPFLVRGAKSLFKRLASASSVAVPAHATVVLPLRFLALMPLKGGRAPPEPAPPSALAGTVFIELVNHEEQPLVVPLAASSAPPDGVSLERSAIGLSPATTKAKTTIAIVGPGVASYVASVSAGRRSFTLHNDAGGVAKFTLSAFKLDPEDPQRATAALRLTNHAQPGQYHGEESLVELVPSALQLEITVRDRLPLWLAFLLVAIGVLIGTAAQRLYALRAQRRALATALHESFAKLNAPQISGVKAASWNIDELKEIATKLIGEIALARDDGDIRESTDRVLDVIARLQRWLRLEPAARRVVCVAEE